MNLIIPMAGKGTRMRPHTLTTPKPFIPIAGKPIVVRLIEELATAYTSPIHTIGFVVNELDNAKKTRLTQLAQTIGARAEFYEQPEALGTAHAILCAAALLQGPVIVAFADTLFKGDFTLAAHQESVIWVKKVKNPSDFGVVKLDAQHNVADFVEKPTNFVSDLAIIGVYYFKSGERLRQALEKLLVKNIHRNGEYQLTNALKNMHQDGMKFSTQAVTEWLDCGNKTATLRTNQHFLQHLQHHKQLVANTAQLYNSVLIPPVYVGEHVTVKNTVLGPDVSVGSYSYIGDSRIQNSIIQTHSIVQYATLQNSMLGNHVHLTGKSTEVSIGDHTTIMRDV